MTESNAETFTDVDFDDEPVLAAVTHVDERGVVHATVVEPMIGSVEPRTSIPAGATCEEASPLSRGEYIPCGVPATAIVRHEKDRRDYLMCDACASHNVHNRGGVLVLLASRPAAPAVPPVDFEQLGVEVDRTVSTHAAALVRKVVDSTHVADRASSLAEFVMQQTVDSADSYTVVCERLRDIKAVRREIERTFEPILAAQRRVLEVTRAEFKRHDEPLRLAELTGKQRVGAWDDAREAERLEAQRVLDAANAAAALEAQLEEASVADAEGRTEDATAIMTQPTFIAPAVVARTTPIVAGISRVTTWHGELTDLSALLLAAAAELADADRTKPRPHFAIFNQPAVLKALSSQLNATAKKDKDNMRLKGARAWSERGTRTTEAR